MSASATMPLLSVEGVSVRFPIGGGLFGAGARILRAVDDIDLTLRAGECLGLVGESGCGKTTLASAIMGLVAPTAGRILLEGEDIAGYDRLARARLAQIVFQDPYSSLNPRLTVRAMLEAPLRLHGVASRSEIDDRIEQMLRHVGLRPEYAGRFPHEFSGGQRQRLGIARAIILRPKVVVLDEPVSALDVSIRAQIINLLIELKESLALSYIMISHDLGVVEHMSDRVAVMYFGRIVETGDWDRLFASPRHPYTRGLIEAIPDPFRKRRGDRITGEIPNPLAPPSGCAFHPRCPVGDARCAGVAEPRLSSVDEAHEVACFRAAELA